MSKTSKQKPEPEYTTCGKCSLYDHSVRRCSYGHVNPSTLKGTIEALKFYALFGPAGNTICHRSKWRKKAMKAYFKT